MKQEYDVVVVGGGMAGLTSAAYLCRAGVSTLLVEKGKQVGGLVNTFRQRGFAFDAGIRAFENSGILFPMLRDLGIDLPVVQNAVTIGIGAEQVCLCGKESLQDYAAMLQKLFPAEALGIDAIEAEIQKVMRYMDVIYGIDNPLFATELHSAGYLCKTLLPWLGRYQSNVKKALRLREPVKEYLMHFTQNAALADMVTQHFFEKTPTFFALSYFGLYLDYCYPLGGTGVLPQKMQQTICAAGGEIALQTAAMQLDPRRHELFLSNGRKVRYRKLIWAADAKTLYRELIGSQTAQVQRKSSAVAAAKGGDSVLTVFLGTTLPPAYFAGKGGAHSFYTPSLRGLSVLPHWTKAAAEGQPSLTEWVEEYLANTTYEISCPALRDAALAPEGETGVIISTLLDEELVQAFAKAGEYESLKRRCTEKVIDLLERNRFPGLRQNIKFALCATPTTIAREIGSSGGAITGWAFTDSNLPAEHRFHKMTRSIYTPITDVLQCGQWSFSPSGLPVAILTGKLAADEARRRLALQCAARKK